MRPTTPSLDAEIRQVRDGFREAAEQSRGQRDAVVGVQTLLADFLRESLAAHQQNIAALGAMRAELAQVKARLRRMNAAKR